MNRKFVKENKSLVREFLSNLIVKILTGKVSKDIEQKLDSDPKIRQHKANIKRIEKQMIDKIKRKQEEDPELAKKLAKLISTI